LLHIIHIIANIGKLL